MNEKCAWVDAKKIDYDCNLVEAWLKENVGPEHNGWHGTGYWPNVTSGWMISNGQDVIAFRLRFGYGL